MKTVKRFTVRLDQEQAELLEVLQERTELSAAEVVRLALTVLDGRLPPRTVAPSMSAQDREMLAAHTGQLQRAGNLFNQAVKSAHIAGWDSDCVEQLMAGARAIKEVLARERGE